MSHLEVLREIEARGLSITATGTDLKLQGPKERIDTELVQMIKANKPELITYLLAPGAFGLTELQRSYLIGRGDLFEIGNVSSQVYREIEGCWDLDRLEAALSEVVARHGMLRTRFLSDGRQVQEPAAPMHIARLDLRGLSEVEQEQTRNELREQRSHRVLPADQAPLVLVEVTILAQDRMVLHVNHDGLVMDGISTFIFFRDWWAAYNGQSAAGQEEASFEAFVTAVDNARDKAPAKRSREYWLSRLDDLAPHPDLPLQTSPAAISRPRFTQHSVTFDAPSWTVLKGHAAGHGLTPSGLLMTAYAETLACWGAGETFTLNTTVANRPPIHPRILEAIGNFSETILVEVEVDRRLTFTERGHALQARLRQELDNRHFSGVAVLRELARRRGNAAEARMPFTFNSAIGYVQRDLDGSTLELFGKEVYNSSQTPQVWLNVYSFEQHGGVVIQFDSVDGLFPDGMIEAMVAGYRSLLEQLLDERAWSQHTFDLLATEQKQRRSTANDTAAPIPGTGVLSDALLAQLQRTPDAAAIITSDHTMSYADLHRRASHAAAWLRAQRVGRNELVGLVMHRGPEQIIGILATIMAGAAYLPVDASLPAERQNYMLTDGGVRCVLTNVDWQDTSGLGLQLLGLDATRPLAGVQTTVAAPAGMHPDDLAYVLYTSGTTGEPKGVMVSHRSVANVVADCNTRFAVTAKDRFFGISAFNFDLSVYDVFGALSAGAAIVLPDRDRATDPAHWLQLCETAGVTVWNSVPAIVSLLHDQAELDGSESLAGLRLVMMSGDRLPPTLPAALWKLNFDLEIVSLGGPTETTIWNILHPIEMTEDGSRSIPYGRPNNNNRAYILDRDGLDTPDWVPGEICAAGTGLARGYWRDTARTSLRFFEDPKRGERLYRTGDMGCYLPNGEIAILGRSDFQIKINGYRIEAGEVETRLIALPQISQAAVVGQTGAHGARLVAHLVPESSTAAAALPSEQTIRETLRKHLPDYMTPSAVIWHESLPLTRNGKVDRVKLAAIPTPDTISTMDSAPDTALERRVAEIWSRILKVADAGVTSTFFELGGDSLAGARLLTTVRKEFGVAITLDRLSEVETIRKMAAEIGRAAR